MADKEVYATGGFRYQTRELRAGDPIIMTGPLARLYRALGKVSFERPNAARASYERQGSRYDAGAAGHELIGRDAKPKAAPRKAAAKKKAPAKRTSKAAK